MDHKTWFFIPFIEQILTACFFLLLAPAGWGFYEIYKGHVGFGTILLACWTFLFITFSIYLHRRKTVRLFISLPLALLVLAVGFWFILSNSNKL